MLFIGLIHATICIVAKDALVKEWDVHKGSSVEYQDEILYSFEFHLNKTSSNTIITIWRSNEKPNIGIKEKVNPRVAQFEIIYESENSGTFKSKTDEKPTKFTFTEDDFSHYSTQFLYNNYNYNIIFISQKVIEILITDRVGNDVDQYVAFLIEEIEVAKLDPKFEKIINNPQKNNQSPEDMLDNAIIKAIAFIQKNKQFIYFALIIFGFQITLYLIFKCIQSIFSPKTENKAKQTKKTKTE